jgi:hypothetical protein
MPLTTGAPRRSLPVAIALRRETAARQLTTPLSLWSRWWSGCWAGNPPGAMDVISVQARVEESADEGRVLVTTAVSRS